MSDDDGELDSVWIELRNGREEVFGIHVNQIPELVSALEQALRCVKDQAPDVLRFDPGPLSAAMLAVARSRT